MVVKKIGVGCHVGAQIVGTQHAASVASTWIKAPEVTIMQNRELGEDEHYIHMIIDVVSRLQKNVKQILDEGNFPLIIGGDHSISMGSIPYKDNTLVLWIDAHGDCNTPEGSITKRIHGMPVAALMGYGDKRLLDVISQPYLSPSQVVYVGVRDLDQKEVEFMNEHGLKNIDHHQPIEDVLLQLQPYLDQFEHVHISFDMDSLDPSIAPGVSTPVDGGLSLKMASAIVEACFKTNKVRSMDIVEFNPMVETRVTVGALSHMVDLVNHYVK